MNKIDFNNKQSVVAYCKTLNHSYHMQNRGGYISAKELDMLIHLANLTLTRMEKDIKMSCKCLIDGDINPSEKEAAMKVIMNDIAQYEKYKETFISIDTKLL
jgi:ribulose-5-phosphate 4-epimerase/fuculose-1-phosphate aldolase